MRKTVRTVLCLVWCALLASGMAACTKRVVAPETAALPGSEAAGGAGVGDEDLGPTEGRGALDEQALGEGEAGAAAGPGAMTRERFVNEDIFFEFDSSALTPEAEAILGEKAQWMRANPGLTVVIEGHCDSRGTNEYNIALGERRAESVKNYMMSLGIGGERMRTISYGEERPLAAGDDEAAWASNRRAHFEFD